MQQLRQLIKAEATPGVLLFGAGLLALILANTPLHEDLKAFLTDQFIVQVGALKLEKPFILWVNDGLMALFFLLVGLELKREIFKGVLSDVSKIILPVVGAIGGLIVPALIFIVINYNNQENFHGWAIPTATDIAFTLGVLSLLGKRVPVELKVFLTALAIIDDIAAILIIAAFYTKELSLTSLSFAAVAITILFSMNANGVKKLTPYCLMGLVLWVSVLKSGVHATLAGIILAFAIPLENKGNRKRPPLATMENAILPWVTILVLPLFAFANSGFSLKDLAVSDLLHPVTLGIALGLFLGKQAGIFSFCWILVKLKLAKLPENISWAQLYAVALLCGIGFTMSLFISSLAFHDHINFRVTRMGIFLGSCLSGICGYFLLYKLLKRTRKRG